jgi:hypothetical protein
MEGGAHDLWSMLLGKIGGPAGQGMESMGKLAQGDESYFQQLEQPAYSAFQQGMGQMGSRFSQMGMGAQQSSGFNLAGSSAAQGLGEQLQSQRLGLQQQAMRDLMGMSQNLLGQQTMQYGLQKKQDPSWMGWLGAGLPIAGAVGGGLIGSVVPGLGTAAGATLGGSMGAAAGKAFLPQRNSKK